MAGYSSLFQRCFSYAICPFLLYAVIRFIFISRKQKCSVKKEILHYIFAFYVCFLLSATVFPIIRLMNNNGNLELTMFFQSGDLFTLSGKGLSHGRELGIERRMNLIPFRTIVTYFNMSRSGLKALWKSIANVLGNVLLFLPFGMLLPLLYKQLRRYRNVLLLGSMVILSLEVMQYITGRSADIDDYLLNIGGCSLGYIASMLYQKKFLKRAMD